MFSGDLLFAGSIGRTDLPGGDHPTMLRSLATKVLPLADDIVVLPGHGEQTSIGRERATNPFLQDLDHRRVRRSSHPRTLRPHEQASPHRPLSGFPELLPGPRSVESAVIATLARTFELHGFANVETRAVEPLDQLLRKGETSKEVYVLRRLQADPDETAATDRSGLGLHFDLTVPFARYVLENAGKLEFPFRRYQIQKAWRGERPQEGRYREFTQADIDIVGRDVLPFHHDVEVDPGDARRAVPAGLPAAVPAPGQQPQADPGLLHRPRRHRRRRGHAGHRQARQAAGRRRPRPARRGGRPHRRAGRPAAWRWPGSAPTDDGLRGAGARARASATRCSTRGSRSSPS